MKKKSIKWLARVLGGLAILLVSYFVLLIFETDLPAGVPKALHSVLMLLGFTFLGYFFAWFREKEGGIVMVTAALVLGMTMYYKSNPPSITYFVLFSLPFIVPGILFWIIGNKKKATDNS